MRRFSLIKGLALTSLVFVMAACGNDGAANEDTESAENNDSKETNIYSHEDFPEVVSNEAEPSGTGTLKIGYTSDSPLDGTFNWAFYTLAPEMKMLEYFDEAVFTYDENQLTTNEGAIHYDMNEEGKTVTFTVQDGINWHDGELLKITDYVASYEVIGHPDYDGVRGSTDGFTLIEGYDEYRAGEADEISGIEVIDDKTAVFTYKEVVPSLTAGGFWPYAFPEHHYEGMEITEIAASPETREKPIGIGPYKVDSIVSGESLSLVKFEDYWRGEPQLDGINIRVMSGSSIANAVESGEVDIVDNFPINQFPDVADMEGVEWLGQIEPTYDYIGFKYGTWDAENRVVNSVPEEMKMGDVELRRAMWHAIDNNAVGERFYNGLRSKATTPIPPYYTAFHNTEIEEPEYSTEEANRVLDEAGYEDTDGDGFRETPEGEPLDINFAAIAGGSTAEPLANYYMQQWREVGLNVELLDGRLIEYNAFYDMLEKDDTEIDVFLSGWMFETDVDPSELYGENSSYNYTRFASEENNELLERGNSMEALDLDTRIEAYNEWQQMMVDNVTVIPTVYRSGLHPVSDNVVNYGVEIGFNKETALYNVGLAE